MTGKVKGQKILFLSIKKRIFLQFLSIAVHTSLLQWINMGFITFWGNTAKRRIGLIPLAFFWPSSHPLHPCKWSEALRLQKQCRQCSGKTSGFSHWYSRSCGTFPWWCAGRKEHTPTLSQIGDAGLASKGEEEPCPSCLYVAQSWNGTAEMQSLKHPEIRHPLTLGLVPFPKGKGSQNYNTLYNLLITAFMKQKPPKSILSSAVTDEKASSEQCTCWAPVLLQLGARDKLTLFPTTGKCRNPQIHPLLFPFPCTKFFSFVACESTCKNDSRAHSSLLNWEPN